jgi:surface antigen
MNPPQFAPRLGINILVIIGMSILVSLPNQASAANVGFLSSSIIAELDSQDTDSLRNTLREALDESEDRETTTWQSSSGKLTVKVKSLLRFTHKERICRKAKFLLEYPNRQSELYQFDLCQVNNNWDVSLTPVSSFNKEDWQLLKQNLQEALATNEDGHASSWTNHKSKRSGVIVPTNTHRYQGKSCRQTAITIFDKDQLSSSGSYTFCKLDTGEWSRFFE